MMSWNLRCEICKDEFTSNDPLLRSCTMCQKVINKYRDNKKYVNESVRTALREAYSHKDSEYVYFKCFYTGIISKFNDSTKTVGHFEDTFVLTLDHEYPNQNRVVVSLNLVNKMKGDIPPKEFKQIILVLSEFFKSENEDKTKASKKLEDELMEICD